MLWWALAAAIALLAAQLLWTIVTPVAPLGAWRPATVRVMSPAARAALFAGFDPFNRAAAVRKAAGPETVTALALTLYGVRVDAATGGGSAIIAGADGVQKVYRVGAEVAPGVTLAAVHFDHVGLSRNGGAELLYLDQSKPAPVAAPGAPVAVVPPATATATAATVPAAPATAAPSPGAAPGAPAPVPPPGAGAKPPPIPPSADSTRAGLPTTPAPPKLASATPHVEMGRA